MRCPKPRKRLTDKGKFATLRTITRMLKGGAMTAEEDAKKVFVKMKHEIHEEMMAQIIKDLQDKLEQYPTYAGPESIFAFVRANAAALLFLCQERKRDRDKRGSDFAKPTTPLSPSGVDIK